MKVTIDVDVFDPRSNLDGGPIVVFAHTGEFIDHPHYSAEIMVHASLLDGRVFRGLLPDFKDLGTLVRALANQEAVFKLKPNEPDHSSPKSPEVFTNSKDLPREEGIGGSGG